MSFEHNGEALFPPSFPTPLSQECRYRALWIRHKPSAQAARSDLGLQDALVSVLENDLDLTILEDDFDYAEACDLHNPDFAIFDVPGGARSVPTVVYNANARLDIPRIGLSCIEPFDPGRVAFLRMMDLWRVDRFFSFCAVASARQSPELVSRLFSVPLWVDGDLYKDYDLPKDFPVSVFQWGVAPDFFPWRASVVPQMINCFPTFVYRHADDALVPEPCRFPLRGSDYARMLSRSRFSLADTSRLDYLSRAHLEIPASGAVLVSSPTADVLAYGFQDLENCILGEGMELLQKVAHVANDPQLYQSICARGTELVRSRFALREWHYLRDWFSCRRSLSPGQVVQQQGVFGAFAAVEGDAFSPAIAGGPMAGSSFFVTMRDSWHKILLGENLDEAEEALRSLLAWHSSITEPWMLLGVLLLLKGKAAEAKEAFLRPFQIRHALEPAYSLLDPEEIAWLSLTGVLLGDGVFAGEIRAEGAKLKALSIRRIEWLFSCQGRLDGEPPADLLTCRPDDRLSIHWTGQLDITAWISLLNRVMLANNS